MHLNHPEPASYSFAAGGHRLSWFEACRCIYSFRLLMDDAVETLVTVWSLLHHSMTMAGLLLPPHKEPCAQKQHVPSISANTNFATST